MGDPPKTEEARDWAWDWDCEGATLFAAFLSSLVGNQAWNFCASEPSRTFASLVLRMSSWIWSIDRTSRLLVFSLMSPFGVEVSLSLIER